RGERRARFMQTQERISAARLARHVGRTLPVLIDQVEGTRAIGRSSADAPEIDGVVYVARARGVKPGDIVDVRIERSDAHDLHGPRVRD
ncbi:MAG: TRAM domain-containing protein, partial [Betaproteobacteria bacterium]|nr:TRAM domain-containing protein [Betaproteobacteria bacterium]